jgi:hypothetical protein
LVDEVASPVGVDPLPQPRPGTQQGLVGDLDGVLFLGEQPALGERVASSCTTVVAAVDVNAVSSGSTSPSCGPMSG